MLFEDFRAPGDLHVVILDHLPDALENFAAHVLGGEFFQQVVNEDVLPGVAAELQFRQHCAGRKLSNRSRNRLDLLLQIGLVGKCRELLPALDGVLVTLGLHVEAGDPLVIFGFLRIDLLEEDFVELVAGDRAGGDPHVPNVDVSAEGPRPSRIAA